MGLDWTTARFIEPGERQRRAQFEAARPLLLRDRDCGQKRPFCGRGVGGVLLEQGLASRSMQFSFNKSMRVVEYPEAHHCFDAFTVPTPVTAPFGTCGYNEKASTQSWSELEAFLKR